MTKKSHYERVIDFLERWNPDLAGRYAVVLRDGRRIVIQDCYLSYDQADRPEMGWVNHDSPGFEAGEFDPLDAVAIVDLEQQFEVVPRAEWLCDYRPIDHPHSRRYG
jgi:hypothetical protein